MNIKNYIHKGIIYGSLLLGLGLVVDNGYKIVKGKTHDLSEAQARVATILGGMLYQSISNIVKETKKTKKLETSVN